MPTKPNPVTDLPPAWGGAGNYTPGVYGPTLPWGDANQLSGQPLPWGNQPRLNSTGLTSFANTGLTPQIPTDASLFNEWLRRVAIWQTDWVALGTSADDADAHIMETDASGHSRAVRYYATQGVAGANGSSAIDLLEGFDVPASKTSTFGDSSTTTWGDNATISGGTSTVPDFDAYQAGEIRWDDQGSTVPASAFRTRFLETGMVSRMPDGGGGTVRSHMIPARGVDVSFSTPNAIATTTSTTNFRAQETEELEIDISFGYQHTAGAATGNLFTRIEIQGPSTQEVFVETWRLQSAIGWLPFHQSYKWKPTDTYITPGTRNYTFTIRAGSNLGANLELRNAKIRVASALQV